ncbi:MAG: C10 family peptidase [Prevotella sp.]|nr:C10 family peptidase [Prevotella sp.]
MKKIVVFLLFLLPLMATADPIDLQSAKRKAGAFLKEKVSSIIDKPMNLAYRQPLPDNEEKTAFYIFNSSDGKGYVIVSGDDRTEQVLGYSPTGHIDPEAMPDNMKYYLGELAKEIANIDNDVTVISRKSKRRAPVKKAIDPLITTHWDQDSPFNNMAPYVVRSNGDTVHCVTGCVATAMAQLMNFYKYPPATIADLPGYTSKSSGFKIDTIPAGATIDWDNMADTYDKNSTPAQCDAVAKLMYLCGVSMKMDYGTSSSGAAIPISITSNSSTLESAFINYFGYGSQALFCQKKNYTSLAWFNLIYEELAEGYPIYSFDNSHAYLIDGYDGDNMFHFNWGWGPGSDGYYLLSAISEYYPDGTTGTVSGYTNDHYILTKLRTHADESPTIESTVKLESCVDDSTLKVQVIHPARLAEESAYGIGYIKDDLGVVPISVCYEDWPYNANGTIISSHPFTIRGLSKGNYRVVAIKKNEGSSVWKAGEDPEVNFANVIIDDNGTITTTMYGYTTDIKVDTMIFVNDPTFGSNNVKVYITKNIDDEKTFDGDITLSSIQETDLGNGWTRTSYSKYDTKSVILKKDETKCLDFNVFLSGKYYGASDTDSLFTFRLTQGGSSKDELGDFKVLVKKSPKISKNIAMTMTPTIESFNTAQNYLYGKSLKMKVQVVNENDSDYVGYVQAKAYIGNRYSRDDKAICLPAGSQTEVEFDLWSDGFPNDASSCKLELKNWCWNGGLSFDKTEQSTFEPLVFTLHPGIKLYYDDGTSECFEAPSSFRAPKNATAIDIRKQNILTSLTLANPNCLVFTDDYSGTPSGVTTNIVKSGKSDNITLTDGYNFATPEKFTATNISYTRTFTKGYRADGTGWTTICLPFDVESVKVKNGSTTTPIDWFHSSTDTGKSFWVREFSADDAPMMRFSPANKMLAAHPYIISFPDGNSGIGKTLTGKPVTFYGSDAVISPTFHSQILGYTYRMTGVTSSSTVNLGFGLNDGDTLFIKKSPLSVQAFRAYFDPVTTGAQSRTSLILAGESQGVSDDPLEMEEKLELVDLGLSVKWANKNLGALTAERPGQLLSWGELTKKGSYFFNGYEYYRSYNLCMNIGSDISGTQYDAAYSQSGGKYRMPTRTEMQELLDRCTITNEIVNGVDGFRVTGPNGNSIFMPASGYKSYNDYLFASDNSHNNRCGFYWTSEPYGSNTSIYANSLVLGTDGIRKINNSYRFYGLAIRPVENRSTILGDLNHDGFVNITDVVLLVNYILGTDEGVVIESEADINGDTIVNITDVVALTNIILGQ